MPIPEWLFFVVFAAVLGYFAIRFLKYGGLRGALYGSAIVTTVGEVQLPRFAGAITTLRVHVLDDGRIVLERSSRTLLSYKLDGYPMSIYEAERLITLLQQARVS